MNVAIIDDEKSWIYLMKETLLQHPASSDFTIKVFPGGEDFLDAHIAFDFIILDIEMEGMDGLETAYQYKLEYPDTLVILSTTHTEYYRQGYMVQAFRFIDKRHYQEQLEEAITSALHVLCRRNTIDFHIVHGGTISVPLRNILYLDTEKRNVRLHTTTESVLCVAKIDELEKELADKGFFRCHRSILVNLDAVIRFDSQTIYLQNKERLVLSRYKYPELKRIYFDYKFALGNG